MEGSGGAVWPSDGIHREYRTVVGFALANIFLGLGGSTVSKTLLFSMDFWKRGNNGLG